MKHSTLLVIFFFFCLLGIVGCIALGAWMYIEGKSGGAAGGSIIFAVLAILSLGSHHDAKKGNL